ncbi:hypothetical protein HDV57DRAFT_53129 [Trichoderma longibrachiatum]|uniref:Uncharacterized protein n=1 Tax=Trichoderma longibrachiatum ATCC 18648 TaxID=983965 RepID=A0A2T4C0G9_TRILO|nr:hypothetical protein M440DRAFT_1268311 [Trichoderma longibrachiatum ATCC 18648]
MPTSSAKFCALGEEYEAFINVNLKNLRNKHNNKESHRRSNAITHHHIHVLTHHTHNFLPTCKKRYLTLLGGYKGPLGLVPGEKGSMTGSHVFKLQAPSSRQSTQARPTIPLLLCLMRQVETRHVWIDVRQEEGKSGVFAEPFCHCICREAPLWRLFCLLFVTREW